MNGKSLDVDNVKAPKSRVTKMIRSLVSETGVRNNSLLQNKLS